MGSLLAGGLVLLEWVLFALLVLLLLLELLLVVLFIHLEVGLHQVYMLAR